MNSERRKAYLLIALGIAIPSLYLGITIPGNNNYTDEGALAALFPWMFIIAGPSLVLLITGIRKLIKSELKRFQTPDK